MMATSLLERLMGGTEETRSILVQGSLVRVKHSI